MRLTRSLFALSLAAGASACALSQPPGDRERDAGAHGTDPGAACASGIRPAITTCRSDSLTAECGGTGEDTWFACTDLDCKLFTGGCVAAGYDRIACDLADPCCPGAPLAEVTGDWIFVGLAHDVNRNFGSSYETLRNAYVVDVVASTPTNPVSTSYVCPATSAGFSSCVPGTRVAATAQSFLVATSGSREIGASGTFASDGFVIDLSTTAGTPKARVCAYHRTDYLGLGCGAPRLPTTCATSGSVTWDGIGSGHAEVVIDGALWILDF